MEHDPVNHPKHYTTLGAVCDKCNEPIECIQVVRHMKYNLGNAIKYIWRCDLKGKSVEDLRKAIWYLQDEIRERVSIKKEISKPASNHEFIVVTGTHSGTSVDCWYTKPFLFDAESRN